MTSFAEHIFKIRPYFQKICNTDQNKTFKKIPLWLALTFCFQTTDNSPLSVLIRNCFMTYFY